MKRFKKIGCFLCSIALLMSMPIVGYAQNSEQTGALPIDKTNSLSFYRYLQKVKNERAASRTIELKAVDAELGNQGEFLDNLDGCEAVSLQEGDSAAWQFEVPESGLYMVKISYYNMKHRGSDIEIALRLDGEPPFEEAGSITLKRQWKDKTAIQRDNNGNDLTPKQEEVFGWQDALLKDNNGYYSDAFVLYLNIGNHELALECTKESVAFAGISLEYEQTAETYDTFIQEHQKQVVDDYYQKYEAEETFRKSNSILIPVYDRSSSATSPSSPSKIRRNTIGQNNWSSSGMTISYEVEAPRDGLYCLTVKYRQNYQTGMATFRNIYINGQIQHEYLKKVAFPFGIDWENQTLSGADGPAYIYLKEGKNTLTFEATIGSWSDILMAVDDINKELNTLYRRIVMVTGTSPDVFRDYYLDREIPGLIDSLVGNAERLFEQADRFDEQNGEKSTQSETLRRVAEQLESFAKKPETIPSRLDSFRNNITTISSWLLNGKQQPLEMDYFIIHSADKEIPSAKAGFVDSLCYSVQQFLSSFVEDYNNISEDGISGESITVWTSEGRDQAQIIKDLIADTFTPDTEIHVNLSLVQGGFIEATLAGQGPDVALGVARGQPINLALRNALVDLSGFATFDEVAARFAGDAMLPYSYRNAVYALPNTQRFFMMYYRTDIFEELGLTPPDTWEDMLDLIPVLQRNNMAVGLPYTTISAQNAIDEGVGARDLFSLLLLQMGGNFYNEELTQTAMDSPEAYEAFRLWTDFYTKYSFELTYDLNTRFRMGEIPLAIASLLMYNTLEAAAPEIKNRWAMAPVPGMPKEDGTIDRSVGCSGNAAVLFKKAESPEACWAFLDWWTSDETQTAYSLQVETLLGPAARNAPANLEAFSQIPWTKAELEAIDKQRRYVREIPEVPGSYFVSRCVDNAFRAVLYSGANPREEFEKQNASINREICRKLQELRLTE